MSSALLAQRGLSTEKNSTTGGDVSAVEPGRSPVEAVQAVVHSATGALDSIFSGGSHPENSTPASVDTSLQGAGGKLGRLGGRVPDFQHTTDAAAAAVKQTGVDVVSIGKDAWSKIRKVK